VVIYTEEVKKLKVEVRHCNKCERHTIQAERPVHIGYDYSGGIYERMWFCPQCGTNWRRETKTTDEEYVPN